MLIGWYLKSSKDFFALMKIKTISQTICKLNNNAFCPAWNIFYNLSSIDGLFPSSICNSLKSNSLILLYPSPTLIWFSICSRYIDVDYLSSLNFIITRLLWRSMIDIPFSSSDNIIKWKSHYSIAGIAIKKKIQTTVANLSKITMEKVLPANAHAQMYYALSSSLSS